MTIVFVFKNGEKLKAKCEEFSITTGYASKLTGYEMNGITENKPIYIDMENIQCIYRVMSDEVDSEKGGTTNDE